MLDQKWSTHAKVATQSAGAPQTTVPACRPCTQGDVHHSARVGPPFMISEICCSPACACACATTSLPDVPAPPPAAAHAGIRPCMRPDHNRAWALRCQVLGQLPAPHGCCPVACAAAHLHHPCACARATAPPPPGVPPAPLSAAQPGPPHGSPPGAQPCGGQARAPLPQPLLPGAPAARCMRWPLQPAVRLPTLLSWLQSSPTPACAACSPPPPPRARPQAQLAARRSPPLTHRMSWL